MDFVIELYKEVQHFPAHEKFGISGQLKRDAVSIPSNIAEGAAREKYEGAAAISIHCAGFSERVRYPIGNLFSSGILGKNCYDRIVLKFEAMSKMLGGLIASIAKKA